MNQLKHREREREINLLTQKLLALVDMVMSDVSLKKKGQEFNPRFKNNITEMDHSGH